MIVAFSQWTVTGAPSRAASRMTASIWAASTPGYMPGGAAPPVKSLKATAPAAHIRRSSPTPIPGSKPPKKQ